MTKQYYCEMDDSFFSTEEDLIKHIKNKYVKVFEGKEHSPSDLLAALQKEFPDYQVSIRDGVGWYAQYIITLENEDSVIDQYYGEDDRLDYSSIKSAPSKYYSMIEELKSKINTVEYITNKVNELYNFAEFKFNRFSYGYSQDEHSYSFSFKVNKEDSWDSEEFYPYNLDEDEFIGELNKYFVTLLEGKPFPFHDDSGYFDDYTINGTKIGMMMRNKKVRLEVIE
ncbi:hypothetical protein EVU96_08595 [Bacillus infantis]|uniref:hypothetical protein n=1 Tax=Bacillus infantis TaxID=324767 RepID=UPI00101C2D92|nr:hypothetical protein [Bacillus infantis]RYI30461.1 hypothetical protein EVU96_08595 [Bacillus infantis]